MKKYLYTVVVLLITVTTTNANTTFTVEDLHGGFQPKLRGWYNNRFDDFKKDVVAAFNANTTTDLFQDPNFLDRLVVHVQLELNDKSVTLQDIINEGYAAPAPAGFIKSKYATHEMSVWASDATTIAMWGARDPYKNEMFLWFRGKCVMSLYCANLVHEIGQQITPPPTPKPGPGEKRDEYTLTKKLEYTPGGNITINVNPTMTLTGGNSTSSVSQQAAPAVTEELGGSNLTVRRRNVVREEIIDDGQTYTSNSQQNIRYSEPGLGFRNVATGVGFGLMGVADIYRAFNNDRRDININSFGYNVNQNIGGYGNNNCYLPQPRQPRNPYVSQYGPGFQGVYNDVPQVRYTNNPYGAPRQGGLTPAQRSASSNYSTNRQEICGNGIDDDGDGLVDEGCSSGGFGWN